MERLPERRDTVRTIFPPQYLLDIGELVRTFAGWDILESGDDGGPAHGQCWMVCCKSGGSLSADRLLR
jgi:hypothetical protein